jgi:hypothetical protein
MTSKKIHLPAAKLDRPKYNAWLKEIKPVLGGTIKLTHNPYSNNDDDVNLEARAIGSGELPTDYAKDLMIFGYYDDFAGFKIYVSVDEYCWLLMGHQTHTEKGFTCVDGIHYGNHPHFHELDFSTPHNKNGLRRVTQSLRKGINSAELLNALMEHYYIEDGTSNVSLPARPKTVVQTRLEIS